jgi:hypothetical protein
MSVAAFVTAYPTVAALGAADDVVAPQSNDKRPALYLITGDDCQEDFAGELAAVGLDVRISRFQTLKSIGRITQIPADLEVSHLLVVGGYVIANHVAPAVVVEILAEKPDIRGVIGSPACATARNHEGLHSEKARPF